jgi:hypothetical protein
MIDRISVKSGDRLIFRKTSSFYYSINFNLRKNSIIIVERVEKNKESDEIERFPFVVYGHFESDGTSQYFAPDDLFHITSKRVVMRL